MDKNTLLTLLEEIKLTAVQSGQIIMEVYNHNDFHINLKSDDSPLTLADKKSNNVICAKLHQISPQIPIISEENKQLPYTTRVNYESCWMVDPLDGTKEFIKRNGEFTVNIALIHQGKSIMGVVYAPVLEKLYWGLAGAGSYVMDTNAVKRLKSSSFTMQDSGLRVVCSRSHLNPETQKFIDDLPQPEQVSKGSSLKFLILAEGEADIYPRLAPTMEWDTAAAQIILEEAGGKVVQFGTKKPVVYNKKNLLNPLFIASGNIADD